MARDPECVFCKIVAGELPGTIAHFDDEITAFEDIAPAAPTHVVVVPNDHVTFLTGLDDGSAALIGRMALVAASVAEERGIATDGYRISINQGPDSGQVFDHLHMHLLGGRPLGHLA
jgi:histidine triad (HIT) family protein